MERKMRRIKQLLPENEAREILARGNYGTLSLIGDEDFPYGVPLNYVLIGDSIYFHCAKSGHKLDALRKDPRVSFCVVNRADVIQEKFTTVFNSVIAFGRAREITDPDEMRAALVALCKKYCPDMSDTLIDHEIESEFAAVCIVKIDIDRFTGKEGIELTRLRKSN